MLEWEIRTINKPLRRSYACLTLSTFKNEAFLELRSLRVARFMGARTSTAEQASDLPISR